MPLKRWAGVAVYSKPERGCWKHFIHLPTNLLSLLNPAPPFPGAREPEEEKPYKVIQDLITIMVVNSYWN